MRYTVHCMMFLPLKVTGHLDYREKLDYILSMAGVKTFAYSTAVISNALEASADNEGLFEILRNIVQSINSRFTLFVT